MCCVAGCEPETIAATAPPPCCAAVKVRRSGRRRPVFVMVASPGVKMLGALLMCCVVALAWGRPYDPDDPNLQSVLPSKDVAFEAFYPREAYGVENGNSRPSHGHASFYQHRNPALVDTNNSPAYGYRFDGKRRFNFDEDED